MVHLIIGNTFSHFLLGYTYLLLSFSLSFRNFPSMVTLFNVVEMVKHFNETALTIVIPYLFLHF